MSLAIHKINLTLFRNYDALRLDCSGARCVVLTGANGSGKTNILEAISLLTPGRGLRRADLGDIKNNISAPEDLWAVAAEVETSDGLMTRLGTGLAADGKRRVVRINGKDAKSQEGLSSLISAVWLTPQMDRIFLEGASGRRRFLDRLIFAFAPEHAGRINRYDKNLRERMGLLQLEAKADPLWLDNIESQLAADAVSIGAARIDLVEQLQKQGAALRARQSLFPAPQIAISGWTEEQIIQRPALAVEDELKIRLKNNRGHDRDTGRTQEGIHRSDVIVLDAARGMPADQCSTGEQKGLLVSIVLAHAMMMQAEKGFTPLLLLDEVAAHLDDDRRAQLFGHLLSFTGQVWMTGTDAAVFEALAGKARFFSVDQGRITAVPYLAAG